MSFKAYIVDSTMRRMEIDVVHASEYDALAAENAALRSRLALCEKEADTHTAIALENSALRSRLAEAKAKADKDVIARNRVIAEKSARLAEAEVLLMEAREFVFGLTRIDDLRDRIDAHLARQP